MIIFRSNYVILYCVIYTTRKRANWNWYPFRCSTGYSLTLSKEYITCTFMCIHKYLIYFSKFELIFFFFIFFSMTQKKKTVCAYSMVDLYKRCKVCLQKRKEQCLKLEQAKSKTTWKLFYFPCFEANWQSFRFKMQFSYSLTDTFEWTLGLEFFFVHLFLKGLLMKKKIQTFVPCDNYSQIF